MVVITCMSVDMFLHYLLAVLIVLLGNSQIIATENEDLQTRNNSLLKGFPVDLKEGKDPSGIFNPETKYENQEKSKFEEGGMTKKEVKELHDPLNILGKINKTGTVHKYSITSEDFAQVTSSINVTSKDSSPITNDYPKEDINGGEDKLSLLIVPVQDIVVDSYKSFSTFQELNSDDPFDEMKTEVQINNPNEVEDSNKLLEETFVESNSSSFQNAAFSTHNEDNQDITNNSYFDLYSNLTFEELVTKMKDDIKTYSNEAVIEWEDIKDRVSKNNEVYHVLNDYHDKITISQAVNNSECVKSHQVKYENRVNFLNEVLHSCESQLKREIWQELQNKTKELLNAVNSIVLESDVAEEKQEDDKNDKLTWPKEKKSKQKLYLLDMESKKQTLSDLKKNALLADEEDYTDCIIQNTGQDVVVDTLNDIMKIKNHCVG